MSKLVTDPDRRGHFGPYGGMYVPETLMMPAQASFTGNDLVWDGYSNIAFWQMAPTLAWNASERLSLGVAVNIDYQQVSFSQRIRDTEAQALYNFNLNRSANAFGSSAVRSSSSASVASTSTTSTRPPTSSPSPAPTPRTSPSPPCHPTCDRRPPGRAPPRGRARASSRFPGRAVDSRREGTRGERERDGPVT